MEIEELKHKVILIIGSHCTSAQGLHAVIEHSNTFNDFIFEIIDKDVEERVQELIEKTRGIPVLREIPLAVYAKSIIAEKHLSTYKQDKSKHYYKRFLR